MAITMTDFAVERISDMMNRNELDIGFLICLNSSMNWTNMIECWNLESFKS